jgi:hypothetical protein
MARKKLSALAIPKLSPGDWHDTIVPGLILRVGAKRQTWTYRYSAGGKKLRLTLGYHPVMGLAEAREACRKTSERVDSGVDPFGQHRRTARDAGDHELGDGSPRSLARPGKKIKTAEAMIVAASPRPFVAAGRRVLKIRFARRSTPWSRTTRCSRAIACWLICGPATLGGTGRCDQLRRGHPQSTGAQA